MFWSGDCSRALTLSTHEEELVGLLLTVPEVERTLAGEPTFTKITFLIHDDSLTTKLADHAEAIKMILRSEGCISLREMFIDVRIYAEAGFGCPADDAAWQEIMHDCPPALEMFTIAGFRGEMPGLMRTMNEGLLALKYIKITGCIDYPQRVQPSLLESGGFAVGESFVPSMAAIVRRHNNCLRVIELRNIYLDQCEGSCTARRSWETVISSALSCELLQDITISGYAFARRGPNPVQDAIECGERSNQWKKFHVHMSQH